MTETMVTKYKMLMMTKVLNNNYLINYCFKLQYHVQDIFGYMLIATLATMIETTVKQWISFVVVFLFIFYNIKIQFSVVLVLIIR